MSVDIRARIARRVALELTDGQYVILGIGIPTLVPSLLPPGVEVILGSENGMTHMGPPPSVAPDDCVVNAGGTPVTVLPGGAFFDSSMSFALIRGGHVDVAVLGALEADARGGIANWIVPGVRVAGMGGGMDLVTGARRLIVAMQHAQKGVSKIVDTLTLPATGYGVDLIVTEMAVMQPTQAGLVLREVHEEYTVRQVVEATAARLILPGDVARMRQ